jgi:hypothetical protein
MQPQGTGYDMVKHLALLRSRAVRLYTVLYSCMLYMVAGIGFDSFESQAFPSHMAQSCIHKGREPIYLIDLSRANLPPPRANFPRRSCDACQFNSSYRTECQFA